jgi:signal transduction histidine kinase
MGPVRRVLVDAALAAVCLVSAVWAGMQSGLFDGETPWFGWRAQTVLEASTGVVTAGAVFVRRRYPVLLSACALVSWGLATAWPALLIAQCGLGAYVRSSWIRITVTIATVAGVGWPLWRVAGPDGSMPLSVALCVVPMLVGLYLTSRREVVATLEQRARAEERALIARDMHDVVTHRVSLMVLHATALEADGKDRAEIAQRIQTIGRTALEELRTLVGVLRDGSDAPLRPQPGLADLEELVTNSRELGLPVELTLGPAVRASSMVEHAVYRVVQEALTNVHRHAPGALTTVTISLDGARLTLVVRNAGGGQVSTAGAGHGLLGIAERVRLVGGTLATRRTADGGFEVVASMPGATT